MTDVPDKTFLEEASERIFNRLAEHPDEGVRAINALTGPLPLDHPDVITVARAIEARQATKQ